MSREPLLLVIKHQETELAGKLKVCGSSEALIHLTHSLEQSIQQLVLQITVGLCLNRRLNSYRRGRWREGGAGSADRNMQKRLKMKRGTYALQDRRAARLHSPHRTQIPTQNKLRRENASKRNWLLSCLAVEGEWGGGGGDSLLFNRISIPKAPVTQQAALVISD